MKRRIGKLLLRLIGWKAVGEGPPAHGCVIVCAPHTSNIDYVLMLLVSWVHGMKLSFLAKDSLFKPPMGWLMRATGGVPVDRSAANGLVGQMVEEFGRNPDMYLAIPAEGTRSRAEFWKSGFYRIAEQAQVPYVLAFVDAATKTSGFGPAVKPSGDVVADMDVARDFYADKVGLKHHLFGPIRLREELPPADGGSGDADPDELDNDAAEGAGGDSAA